MKIPSKYMEEAVEQLATLPSIGKRSALRLVIHLLNRKPEEIESYIARDPIEILGNKMVESGVITDSMLSSLTNQINNYVENIFISMLKQNKTYLGQFDMIKQ